MKKTLIYSVFFALLTMSFHAQSLDQSNTVSSAPNISPSPGDTLAQSFTAGISGFLTHVEFRIKTDDCSNLDTIPITVFLYAGDGPQQAMDTQSFELPKNMADTLYAFVFDNPIQVVAGNAYTVAFHVEGIPNCDGLGSSTYLWFSHSNANPYPNGSVYDMASSTHHLSNYDLSFNTYVACASIADFEHPTCGGYEDGSVDLNVSGSAIFTYNWSNGATTQDLTDLPQGTYTVQVSSDQGCSFTDSVVLVDPYSTIEIDLVSTTENNCHGDANGAINITVSGGEPGPGYSFSWNNNAGTNQNPLNLPEGTYTVVVTDSVGCAATDSFTIDAPDAIDVTTTTVSTTMTANLTGAEYQWIDCNDNGAHISGATSMSYQALSNGSYAVIVTVDQCSDTSDCIEIASVGMNEFDIQSSIVVYPNPSQGSFAIDFGNTMEAVSVSVLDLSGRIIQTEQYENVTSANLAMNVPDGLYLVQVQSETINTIVELSIKK